MRVRKRIISEVRGCNDKAEQTKSLALILFYQMRLLQNESEYNRQGLYYWRVRNFSYNKIRKVTGLHIATIRKRIRTAERNGWIKRVKNDLVFDPKQIKSSHQRNNYILHEGFQKITELQDWLLAHIIVNIQEAKECAKDIFGRLKNPKDIEEYQKMRCIVKERYPKHTEFADYGISYKCLVMNMGVRRTKLKGVLKFAEKHNIIHRVRNIRQVNENETAMFRELERTGYLLNYLKMKYHRLVHYYFHRNSYFLCFPNTYLLPVPSPSHPLKLHRVTKLEVEK